MIACRGRGRGLGQARVLQELGVGGVDLGLTGPLAHSFLPMILRGTDVGLIPLWLRGLDRVGGGPGLISGLSGDMKEASFQE